MTSGFDYLKGTPCASCRHMGWDLLRDEPCLLCTAKVPSKHNPNRLAAGSWYCEKNGWCFYQPEDWKAQKAEEWAKKNGCLSPDTAAPLERAIFN